METISLNWMLIAVGVVFGIAIPAALIVVLGRAFFKRIDLNDRGEWDRPLPAPIPKDLVLARYKRRRRSRQRHHRHHHHHYWRRHSEPD